MAVLWTDTAPLVLLGIFVIILLHLVGSMVINRNRFKGIPGPYLASFSDLDRLWSCATGSQLRYHLALHERYGPIVRTGPNHVSIADGRVIPQIYNISSKFFKSDFYNMYHVATPDGVVPSSFSVQDEQLHKTMKKPIASAYTMSSMRALEPMNDECSAILCRKMAQYVDQSINLGDWLHWYAIDVIMSLTFSRRLDFMEQEKDIDHVIEAMEGRQVYNSIVGQVPSLHKYMFGNPVISWLASFIPSIAILNSSKRIIAFTQSNLARYQSEKDDNQTGPLDMLARFKTSDPDTGAKAMSDAELLMHTSGNIFAGSDTTAATLRAIFYYLSREPATLAALLAEIDAAEAAGRISDPVTFAEAQNLPYLQAVIKEAGRMHPAVGLPLQRAVPRGGAELAGRYFPEGTVVGVHPWVSARAKDVYGHDADRFRPERWLEADEQRLKLMERNFLSFGGGSRSCLGKNVSLLEMSKVVPQLLRTFVFEVEREWTLHCYWFCWQKNLVCKVRRREK